MWGTAAPRVQCLPVVRQNEWRSARNTKSFALHSATQGTFDPGTLGHTATVHDKACPRQGMPQLVEQRVGGFTLAAIRFHQGGEVVPVRPVQGILAQLFYVLRLRTPRWAQHALRMFQRNSEPRNRPTARDDPGGRSGCHPGHERWRWDALLRPSSSLARARWAPMPTA